MRLSQNVLHRSRITIELASPMMISTGSAAEGNDNDVVRDENGLPMIPATSIAGVVKSLAGSLNLTLKDDFGKAGDDKLISSVQFSDALVHDAENTVCEARKETAADPCLTLLKKRAPVQRNGVALDYRGVGIDKALYDRALVPTGTRFTFECSVWASEKKHDAWQQLLQLFSHPLFRLGAGSRAGYGKVQVVSAPQIVLDLSYKEEAGVFRALPKALATEWPATLKPIASQASAINAVTLREATLYPEDGWCVGGGAKPLSESETAPVHNAFSEPVIVWDKTNNASIQHNTPLLPGTSLKGAFTHRLAFHYRRLTARWATAETVSNTRETALQSLLGHVDGDRASRGFIWFDDTYVKPDPAMHVRTRNRIDRLTGGTIDKALFKEERIVAAPVTVTLNIDERAFDILNEDEQAHLTKAIDLTWRDLTQGRLAVGAGQSTGNGFFSEA
jgi:CRISPR/Cas system CSM-associated protein Csm3 (group 7 of RAMP superfamily)